MTFAYVIFTALSQLRENKLRSFFTLLGIIVSVTFLVAVVAIIQGMNSYVSTQSKRCATSDVMASAK